MTKVYMIDNTAAAGAACAVLLIQALPELKLVFDDVSPFGWTTLIRAVLSGGMLVSALLVIFRRAVGWGLVLAAEIGVLIWLLSAAVAHPVLLRVPDFVMSAAEAIVVAGLAAARLRKAAQSV